MNLESCVTVQYILNTHRLNLTNEDISVDSPYNTYKNKGLPEGPIANPGQAAIEAALYPDEDFRSEGYLFFCVKEPTSGELYLSLIHILLPEKRKGGLVYGIQNYAKATGKNQNPCAQDLL